MQSRWLAGLAVLFSMPAVAELPVEPLHFLSANWAIDARSVMPGPASSAMNFGFQQADLTSDQELADTVLASNSCFSRARMQVVPEEPFPLPTVTGSCLAEVQWPVSSEPYGFVVPGGEFPPFTVDDRFEPLAEDALSGGTLAFTTNMGPTSVVSGSLGFERLGFSQSFVAGKSENAQIEDLAGDWAFTRLELEAEPLGNEMNYTVLTFPAMITTNQGGALSAPAGTEFIESEFFQKLDGSGVEKRRFESTTEEDIEVPLDLLPDGELVMITGDTGQAGRDPQILAGFIAPTADFLVWAEGVPGIWNLRQGETELPDVSSFSAHQLFVGIKRNNNPNLAGNRYRLTGLTYHAQAEGFEVSRWSGPARLHFSSSMHGDWLFATEGHRVALGNADLNGILPTAQCQSVTFDYQVESDGRIFLNTSGGIDEVEQQLINGYASPDNRVLVFAHALSLDNAQSGEIGMWIAQCTNCDGSRRSSRLRDARDVASCELAETIADTRRGVAEALEATRVGIP